MSRVQEMLTWSVCRMKYNAGWTLASSFRAFICFRFDVSNVRNFNFLISYEQRFIFLIKNFSNNYVLHSYSYDRIFTNVVQEKRMIIKETKLKRKKTIKVSSFMRTFIGKFMAHHTCSGNEVVQNRLKLHQPFAFTLIIGLVQISGK